MSKTQITNCHVHLFNGTHVPIDYPYWFLRPFKKFPFLIKGLEWLMDLLGQEGVASKLGRLYQFQKETDADGQEAILRNLQEHYPSDTRFVVLPMDLSQIGYGAPQVPLRDQHNELARLAQEYDTLVPFAMIDPRADPKAKELWRAIDDLGFKGVKIYPRLGYAPHDQRLMDHVYPRMQERGLPLMTHCSRGGVQGRHLSDEQANAYTAPDAYVPVMKAFPDLKICLAHFGGQNDWAAYANPSKHKDDIPIDDNWQVQIRKMIGSGDYPNLYTDISYTLFHFEDYIPFLRLFLGGDVPEHDLTEPTRRLREKVLFGSDFYMTRQEKLSERAVCFRLRNALGEGLFRQIAQDNPKRWLG